MRNLICRLIGHTWRWTHVRDGWGWAPVIAGRRCGFVPALPLGEQP